MLSRTFGCVRVVWNRTLAARRARWHTERTGTSYAETDRALTALKKDPDLAFLNEVSAVRSSRRSATSRPRSPRSSRNGPGTLGLSPG